MTFGLRWKCAILIKNDKYLYIWIAENAIVLQFLYTLNHSYNFLVHKVESVISNE